MVAIANLKKKITHLYMMLKSLWQKQSTFMLDTYTVHNVQLHFSLIINDNAMRCIFFCISLRDTSVQKQQKLFPCSLKREVPQIKMRKIRFPAWFKIVYGNFTAHNFHFIFLKKGEYRDECNK